ncbi:DUF421 domain-containing protein [Rhodobacteraceae bacterium 2CG4]|uniref:DUF421 domain-containing protein n=1 Tax=Halovulum marinum TaxID=2662447 RepID=A0A6L5Z130_9RHOB|nr:YetF domain-containing protein [Halovulum marinum]MSU90273.1 DUF421 domain-containing protein [Halovulum marinum]
MELQQIFGSSPNGMTALQLAARAVVIFVFAVTLFRMLPRKSLGNTSVTDVLLTVLIGSSLSRVLTGNAPLGPVLIACLVLSALWVAMSWLAVHNEWVSRLVKGRPMVVIRDGEVQDDVLRQTQMGKRDLEQSLHQQGLRGPGDVERAYIERNGAVSVVEDRD